MAVSFPGQFDDAEDEESFCIPQATFVGAFDDAEEEEGENENDSFPRSSCVSRKAIMPMRPETGMDATNPPIDFGSDKDQPRNDEGKGPSPMHVSQTKSHGYSNNRTETIQKRVFSSESSMPGNKSSRGVIDLATDSEEEDVEGDFENDCPQKPQDHLRLETIRQQLLTLHIQNRPSNVTPIARRRNLHTKKANSSSIFQGVSRTGLVFQSTIAFSNVKYHLGYYASEWDAGTMYAWAYGIIHGKQERPEPLQKHQVKATLQNKHCASSRTTAPTENPNPGPKKESDNADSATSAEKETPLGNKSHHLLPRPTLAGTMPPLALLSRNGSPQGTTLLPRPLEVPKPEKVTTPAHSPLRRRKLPLQLGPRETEKLSAQSVREKRKRRKLTAVEMENLNILQWAADSVLNPSRKDTPKQDPRCFQGQNVNVTVAKDSPQNEEQNNEKQNGSPTTTTVSLSSQTFQGGNESTILSQTISEATKSRAKLSPAATELLHLQHPSKLLIQAGFVKSRLLIPRIVTRDHGLARPVVLGKHRDSLTNRDVIFGRGNFANYHPGNVWFRSLTSCYRDMYASLSHVEKNQLANNLVQYIRFLGGRFLEQQEHHVFFEAGDKRAITKTTQVLRDGKKPESLLVQSKQGLSDEVSKANVVDEPVRTGRQNLDGV